MQQNTQTYACTYISFKMFLQTLSTWMQFVLSLSSIPPLPTRKTVHFFLQFLRLHFSHFFFFFQCFLRNFYDGFGYVYIAANLCVTAAEAKRGHDLLMSGQREIKHKATIVRLFGPRAENIFWSMHLRTISASFYECFSNWPSSLWQFESVKCANKMWLSVWLVVKNDWNWFFSTHHCGWNSQHSVHTHVPLFLQNDGKDFFCSRRNSSNAKVQVISKVNTLQAAIGVQFWSHKFLQVYNRAIKTFD